ncbi:VWA domain-containing protein [Candidatus Woesearchaeota archaeon]|nr:VWA domain-containing protein [Candidatus Woesearchaeota archaeon]
MILLLLIAFAFPFTTKEVSTHGDPVIKLLVDNTESMKVFGDSVLESLKSKIGKNAPVEISQISSGKVSDIGDGILRKIEGNDNLLILSDGNSNFGKSLIDVGIYSKISDTKLFAFEIVPEANDAYVEIIGPSDTIEDTPNLFKIKVGNIGAEPAFTLQIYIDDKLEFTGGNVREKDILHTFGKGYHKITAKIELKDYFVENNVFYKTVNAVPKPEVLFVSPEPGPLERSLGDIYHLTITKNIPDNLEKYFAVVMDNVHYSAISGKIDGLIEFLINGGGIVFIGGRNSFDRGGYEGTLVESMLPVKVGSGKIVDQLQHNIIIIIDVSDSFSDFAYKKGATGSALDLGKGIAVKMVETFRDDINVGVVAFASLAQNVAEPTELKGNREVIIDKIKRIGSGQGTAIDQGLIWASRLLDKVKGTKNVILISDGKMGNIKEPPAPKSVAEKMAKDGVRIYTVGLHSLISGQETINRQFLKKLASIGSGSYFEPEDYQYLNIFFGKPEAKEKIFSGNSNLAIVDKDHFITNALDINARVSGVNFVVPKLGAKSLIFTGDGNPVLNSWNFGLGRVVTFASDDGREWAGQLLDKENSILITRMINYAVGNPEKDKEILIDVKDSYLGEDNEVIVKSKNYPVSKEIAFVKEGQDIYKASFRPNGPGYFQFFDALVAVNNYKEYYRLGLNKEIYNMVSVSGGKVIKLDESITDELTSYTLRTETDRVDLRLYPLAMLLAIYIIEVFIRKIFEHSQSIK